MPKICCIIASMKAGGMERVMSELCNYGVRNDLDISLVLLHKNKIFYKLDERVKIIEPSFISEGYWKFIYIFRLLYYIRRNVINESPTSVLTFGRIHNPYVVLSLAGRKIPIFVSDRGSPYYKGRIINELLRVITYKKVNGIISQTKFSAAFIERTIGHPKIKVIPNPIRNIQEFEVVREEIVLFIGRLIKKKGVRNLIKCFKGTGNTLWKLVIVGDGPQKEELVKLTEELGLSGSVRFVCETNDIDIYLASSQIFAFPSEMEGFPNVLAEAMAHGLACVSYNCITGPSELIVDNKSGFLVEVGDLEGFTKKLSTLMNDADLRNKFGTEARKVRERFSLEKIGSEYFKFITGS